MDDEKLKRENQELREAMENAILNLQSYVDTWDDVNFMRRGALKRTLNKLKVALKDEEALRKIAEKAARWKQLGEL